MLSFIVSVLLTSLVIIGPCLFFLAYVSWKNPSGAQKRLALVYAVTGSAALIAGIIHMCY